MVILFRVAFLNCFSIFFVNDSRLLSNVKNKILIMSFSYKEQESHLTIINNLIYFAIIIVPCRRLEANYFLKKVHIYMYVFVSFANL